jgi:hypothetical protein
MSINLNDTTPSAPAGKTNVTWQKDGSGNVSASLATSAAQLSGVDATVQGANIAATNLVASPAAGVYRVSIYIIVTRAATSSSTMPSVAITWTDKDSGVSQSITATATSGGNTTTTYATATVVLDAQAAAAIQYSTSGFATSGLTSMQYALHVRVESLS